MPTEFIPLLATAVAIACLHTLSGPDHYLPFIALAKTRGWSLKQTLLWTAACGCGHIGSSVLLGLGGAAIGWSISKIEGVESARGDWAGWGLLVFGLLYGVWGLIRATQNRRHKHFDYSESNVYVYEHRHGEAVAPQERYPVTPWVMFLIFVLGPCEPMIPLLYFPAIKSSWTGIVLLIAVYTFFTLLVMLLMVVLGYYGIRFLKTEKTERYLHVLGGAGIAVCGAGMVFMGW